MGNAPLQVSDTVDLKKAIQKSGAIPVTSRYVTSRDVKCDYKVGPTVLGTGANGAVLLAKSKTDGNSYAIKSLPKSLKSEAEVYLRLDHPHIARLERVYETETKIHLVMECLKGGELFDRVIEGHGFTEKRAARALQQMLSAVAYLHGQNVVHRDLKLENFLVEDHQAEHLKLIDFGFAQVWDGRTQMSEPLGTESYVAPEVLTGGYTEKADMWSMGVIAFMMLTAQTPFRDRKGTQCGRRDPRTSARFDKLSSSAKNFVNSLLTLDPAKRLSAAEALKHPWICNTNHTTCSPDVTILCRLQQFAKSSIFKRACLSVVAWSLPSKDQTTLRKAFNALDVDNNGTIELADFIDVLCGSLGMSRDEARTIFTYLDTNHDQKISYSEFLAATLKLSKEVLEEAFRRFDANNRGVITLDDLDAIFGKSYGGCDIGKLMHEADYNGDGQITYAEFEKYMRDADCNDDDGLIYV